MMRPYKKGIALKSYFLGCIFISISLMPMDFDVFICDLTEFGVHIIFVILFEQWFQTNKKCGDSVSRKKVFCALRSIKISSIISFTVRA